MVRQGGDVRLLRGRDIPPNAESSYSAFDCAVFDHSCWVSGYVSFRLILKNIYINKVAVCLFVCLFVCPGHYPLQLSRLPKS